LRPNDRAAGHDSANSDLTVFTTLPSAAASVEIGRGPVERTCETETAGCKGISLAAPPSAILAVSNRDG